MKNSYLPKSVKSELQDIEAKKQQQRGKNLFREKLIGFFKGHKLNMYGKIAQKAIDKNTATNQYRNNFHLESFKANKRNLAPKNSFSRPMVIDDYRRFYKNTANTKTVTKQYQSNPGTSIQQRVSKTFHSIQSFFKKS